MRDKPVAILGTGPSAIFATMACNKRNITPDIYSNNFHQTPAGAFYYHWIPADYEAWIPRSFIDYTYYGEEKTYILKQWGDIQCSTSFGKYSHEYGYDPKEVFEVFVELAKTSPKQITSLTTGDIFNLCEEYKIVICTFPLPETKLSVQPVMRPVTVEKEDSGRFRLNKIEYSGLFSTNWVRRSHLFGTIYTEYADLDHVPSDEVDSVAKIKDIHPLTVAQFPLIPNNLYLVGRYAEVRRDRLSHEAYKITEDILNAI